MDSIPPHAPAVTPGAPVASPTSVYRYYDSIGVLIYVGITKQGMGRNAQHNGKAEWWPFVARQEVDHYPTRPAALAREKQLIQHHRPPFNKQHNPVHTEMREAYLAYARAFSHKVVNSPHAFYCELDRRLPMDVMLFDGRLLTLQSRLEHGPLASLLKKGEGEPAVRGRRRQYGYVERIEHYGPVLMLHCRIRSPKKTRPPEGGIGAAEVVLSWANNGKPDAHPVIRHVMLTEGDIVERGAA